MKQWYHDLAGFLFPVYCPVCGVPLHVSGEVLCLKCEWGMPRTGYTEEPGNAVARIFWGRVDLEGATSLFRFEKGSRNQALLHQLKYKGQQNIGIFLGRMLGAELAGTLFSNANVIIPVPLHPKKERSRGFNQSCLIAMGVSEVTGIPVENNLLIRKAETASQTRRSRFERWKNMETVFGLSDDVTSHNPATFLLIDDVVTTGATLEGCATELLKIEGARVFVATVACA